MMIQARGNSSICKEMALTYTELITIKDLANNLSQKECAYKEHVTETCISMRVQRAMKRNGYNNKIVFLSDCYKLLNNP